MTAPLPPQKPATRYAFEQIPAPAADDDLFVCLTFSGGGTRAAAFSYGVLQKLRDTPIVRAKDGRHETLLDEVDCISSVSGGSFTAAYYALFGARIFQDYRSVFLDRDVEGELFWKAANPLNWPRLLSPYFSRIDLAAELYGGIFQNKTYADLLTGAHRPFIILNGTDLATGDAFEFTQDQFDLIGSDLTGLPIARAVAASSAFPFLLTPITFNNHQAPGWYQSPAGLKHAASDYYVNRRRFTWAEHQSTYLDKSATPYVHVMDGGLADNIGLRALERQMVDPTGFVARRYNLAKASKVIFIVVDSKAGEPPTYNKSESAPGLADVAFKTATTSMDNFSAETIEFLHDRQRELDQARQDIELCKQVARTRERLSQLRGAGGDSRRRRQPRGDPRSGAPGEAAVDRHQLFAAQHRRRFIDRRRGRPAGPEPRFPEAARRAPGAGKVKRQDARTPKRSGSDPDPDW